MYLPEDLGEGRTNEDKIISLQAEFHIKGFVNVKLCFNGLHFLHIIINIIKWKYGWATYWYALEKRTSNFLFILISWLHLLSWHMHIFSQNIFLIMNSKFCFYKDYVPNTDKTVSVCSTHSKLSEARTLYTTLYLVLCCAQ